MLLLAFMFSSFKKLKALSFAAALVFLLATSFLSAHSHAANQGDKDHSCSVCHVSHAHQKTLVGNSPLKVENFRLAHRVVVLHFVAFSSDPFSSSLIRGPPVLS